MLNSAKKQRVLQHLQYTLFFVAFLYDAANYWLKEYHFHGLGIDARYILPFSHDEVVHGRKTIINKRNGCYEDKFAQARLLYLYMMTHPGKKINFMGNELALFNFSDKETEIAPELDGKVTMLLNTGWESFGGE